MLRARHHHLHSVSAQLAAGLLAFVLISGCDETQNPVPPQTDGRLDGSLELLLLPDLWALGDPGAREIRVKLHLDDVTREAIFEGDMAHPRVNAAIHPLDDVTDTTAFFALHDDGGQVALNPAANYLRDRSGDLVPRDLVFTVRLDARFTGDVGDYLIRFRAASEQEGYSAWLDPADLQDTLTVAATSPPVLSAPILPDSLHAGFAEQTWSVNATDPDDASPEAIASVTLQVLRQGSVRKQRSLTAGGDGSWSLTTDNAFATALVTDSYTFRLVAEDLFGLTDTLEHTVWIENTAPELFGLAAPDTMRRPSSGENLYHFRVSVRDAQSLADLGAVTWTAIFPGSGSESDPFTMSDDGNTAQSGDSTAGDGRFAYPVTLTQSTIDTVQSWPLRFHAVDRAGNLATVLEDTVIIAPAGGGQ